MAAICNSFFRVSLFRYTANTYTLKNKVRLVDMWLWDNNSGAVATDVAGTAHNTFVIGWPTVSYVAVFQTADEKRSWCEKLQQ
jgi:hypothetical protein